MFYSAECQNSMLYPSSGRSLKKRLEQIFEDSVKDMEDTVTVKQWLLTDRTMLLNLQLSVCEFVEAVVMLYIF